MADWQTNSSEIVYETPWFKIHRDEVLNHNGKHLTYSYMELPQPGSSIVPVNAEGKILLQRNFRYTIQDTVWEFPAGHTDGDDPLVAAKRELQEEADLVSDDWVFLGEFYVAPGVANTRQNFFLARNVRAGSGERDKDEQITSQTFFSLDEINAMLLGGKITTYSVPLALHLAKLHGLTKEEK